jgi:hypothetical protein
MSENTGIVVVRTYSAGVHIGRVVSRTDTTIVLADARRLWRWQGANTLHEVATVGVLPTSQISEPISEITLATWIEILPVSERALSSLTRSGWGK